MTDGVEEHPDLGAVGAEMRQEWRAETEAATEDAAAQWRHGRGLADWLGERASAGDRIAVTIGQQRFAGLVEEVGDDLIGLRAVFGRVDIHLVEGPGVHLELVDHPTQGGERVKTGGSFYNALLARDATDTATVGTVLEPEGLDGTVYVGKDFVSIVTRLGRETVVPIRYVLWVSARR